MGRVMRRRQIIAGSVAALAVPLSGAAFATLRWHASPRRTPYLTDAHLQKLRDLRSGPEQRVLFVGNSMTLQHDLPAAVADLAVAEGYRLQVGTAAARGARLVETWRIDAFLAVLEQGWDVLVLQDFSTTCLRAPDRWGSAFAMREMARAARASEVLLYPTWAFPPRHSVYLKGAGAFSNPPADPAAFARCITAHYAGIAQARGWVYAPVTEAMGPDATPFLEDDLHHPNGNGTALIAATLWDRLRPLLRDQPI